MAAMWAVSLWANGQAEHSSGTGEMVNLLGLHFTASWMLGMAVLPMVGLLIQWLPLSVVSSALSLFTWGWLLLQMVLHGHVLHLSAGSCLVGVLACVRADFALAARLAQRYL